MIKSGIFRLDQPSGKGYVGLKGAKVVSWKLAKKRAFVNEDFLKRILAKKK